MSNPIFGRVEKDVRSGYAGFGGRGRSVPQPAPAQQSDGQLGAPTYPQPTYPQAQPAPAQRGVTLDDVMVRTGVLFAIMLVVAAGAWALAPTFGLLIWGAGLVGTLAIGFAIAFMRGVNVPLIIAYAVFEGLFVGAISRSYATVFDGYATADPVPLHQSIVVQAVLGTLCVFAAMLMLYKTGLVKVTAKFRSVVSMMLVGYLLFALVNLVFALVTNTPFGIGGTGIIGIGISVFAIGLAAVTLMLDFDDIETAIATGAPVKYSWLLGMGLLVTLVWLYLEILRLLGRLRSSD